MITPAKQNTHTYYQTLNRIGWSMLLFIGFFYTITLFSELFSYTANIIAQPVLKDVLTAASGIVSSVGYMAPFFLTGLFYMHLSRHTRTERIRFEVKLPREFPLLILAGLAIITMSSYINYWFCELIGYTMPDEMITAVDYSDPAMVIMYMTVALAPAFAEEFLFRGVFYSNLRPYGRTQAILLSSFLFALMHQNISQIFYTFAAGVAMALMYELTGSIWCSVFFHMINNELAVITEVFYYGGYGKIVSVLLTVWDVILILLGIVSIVLLVFYYRKENTQRKVKASGGVFGISKREALEPERTDYPLPARAVVKGAFSPGMIVFTSVTVFLMGLTWLMLIIINAGVGV